MYSFYNTEKYWNASREFWDINLRRFHTPHTQVSRGMVNRRFWYSGVVYILIYILS